MNKQSGLVSCVSTPSWFTMAQERLGVLSKSVWRYHKLAENKGSPGAFYFYQMLLRERLGSIWRNALTGFKCQIKRVASEWLYFETLSASVAAKGLNVIEKIDKP